MKTTGLFDSKYGKTEWSLEDNKLTIKYIIQGDHDVSKLEYTELVPSEFKNRINKFKEPTIDQDYVHPVGSRLIFKFDLNP